MSLRRASTRGPRPLDIHKKLTILRTTNDVIIDDGGSKQSISAKDLERDEEEVPVIREKKLNIPIPIGKQSDDYETRIKGGYEPPVSYIRLVKKINENDDVLEYVLEHSDVEWLRICGHSPSMLDENRLERMIDELEKATGVNAVIPQSAAEVVLNTKLGITASSASREVIADVYQYWLSKRSKLKHPLLRSLWPVAPVSDTDPHHVFRAIVKERYKLRRNRKNDMESFRRLQQLRRECELVRDIVDLVSHREKVKQMNVMVGGLVFDQQLKQLGIPFEATDTRTLGDVKEMSDMLKPPLLGEDATIQRMSRMKSRLKIDKVGDGVDSLASANLNLSDSSRDGSGAFRVDATIRPPPVLPSFMESLSLTTCLDTAALDSTPWPKCLKPRINSYDGSSEYQKETDASHVKYECRGRVGRGGRIIIDRIPTKRTSSHQLYGPTRINSLCRIPLRFPKKIPPDYSYNALRYSSTLPDASIFPPAAPLTDGGASTVLGSSESSVRFDKRKFDEIYDRSDSEDEELRPSRGAPLAQGASIKFELIV